MRTSSHHANLIPSRGPHLIMRISSHHADLTSFIFDLSIPFLIRPHSPHTPHSPQASQSSDLHSPHLYISNESQSNGPQANGPQSNGPQSDFLDSTFSSPHNWRVMTWSKDGQLLKGGTYVTGPRRDVLLGLVGLDRIGSDRIGPHWSSFFLIEVLPHLLSRVSLLSCRALLTKTLLKIDKKRNVMFEMFQDFWRACINATNEKDNFTNRKMMADKHSFVADVIIANSSSFAHIHCAERLVIPLHLMFTFPASIICAA